MNKGLQLLLLYLAVLDDGVFSGEYYPPTAQPADDDDSGEIVPGVEEMQKLPGEHKTDDVRGPMPV